MTTKTFRIENSTSGHVFGTYSGETAEQAITAMMRDAGSDEEPSEDLVAVEVGGEPADQTDEQPAAIDPRELDSLATEAATKHLAAIGWVPGEGLTDAALGLGEDWGGRPEGVSAQDWAEACRRMVRMIAGHREHEMERDREDALEAAPAMSDREARRRSSGSELICDDCGEAIAVGDARFPDETRAVFCSMCDDAPADE